MKHARHPRLRILFAVILVLLCCLPASMYIRAQQRIARQTTAKFDEHTDAYVRELQHSLETYGNVLYSTRGLFAAGEVNDASWDRFITNQSFAGRYPGLRAAAFAQIVPYQDAAAFERKMQNTLGADVHIHPKKDSGDYALVVYHKETSEPSTGQQSLGLDIASNETRTAALESAWKSGGIVATAPIKLANSKDAGFLLVTPVTSINGKLSADKPFGYAVAIFNIQDLINTSIGKILEQSNTSIEIRDVTGGEPILFYMKKIPTSQRTIARNVTIDVGGRKWQLDFTAPSASILTTTDRMAPNIMMGFSIALILLSSTLVYIFRLRREITRKY